MDILIGSYERVCWLVLVFNYSETELFDCISCTAYKSVHMDRNVMRLISWILCCFVVWVHMQLIYLSLVRLERVWSSLLLVFRSTVEYACVKRSDKAALFVLASYHGVGLCCTGLRFLSELLGYLFSRAQDFCGPRIDDAALGMELPVHYFSYMLSVPRRRERTASLFWAHSGSHYSVGRRCLPFGGRPFWKAEILDTEKTARKRPLAAFTILWRSKKVFRDRSRAHRSCSDCVIYSKSYVDPVNVDASGMHWNVVPIGGSHLRRTIEAIQVELPWMTAGWSSWAR